MTKVSAEKTILSSFKMIITKGEDRKKNLILKNLLKITTMKMKSTKKGLKGDDGGEERGMKKGLIMEKGFGNFPI